MRIVLIIAAAAFSVAAPFLSGALAVPAGRTLEWKTGSSTVVFDGAAHARQGLKCAGCHPDPFMMKKDYADMKMVQIIKGKHCGKCHNGKEAFPSDQARDCGRCHRM